MAWIESHQGIERHPKTLMLAGEMEWCVDQTIGKLHRFWWWALEFAPTGDLRGKNDAVLAGSVGLAASEGHRFVNAMVKSCWIDRRRGVFRVHDWIDYAGRYLRDTKFKSRPELWLATQQLYERSADCQPKVGCTNQPLPTNQPTKTSPTPPGAQKPRAPAPARGRSGEGAGGEGFVSGAGPPPSGSNGGFVGEDARQLAVASMLTGIKVNPAVVQKLMIRKDVTPGKLRLMIEKFQKDSSVSDVAAVVVHTLNKRRL